MFDLYMVLRVYGNRSLHKLDKFSLYYIKYHICSKLYKKDFSNLSDFFRFLNCTVKYSVYSSNPTAKRATSSNQTPRQI